MPDKVLSKLSDPRLEPDAYVKWDGCLWRVVRVEQESAEGDRVWLEAVSGGVQDPATGESVYKQRWLTVYQALEESELIRAALPTAA